MDAIARKGYAAESISAMSVREATHHAYASRVVAVEL